jgi:hypothetical protein
MAISRKSVNLTTFIAMVRAAANMERQPCRSYTPVQGVWTLNESEGLWHHLWSQSENEMLTILDAGEDECGLSYDLFDNGSRVLIPEGLGEHLDNLEEPWNEGAEPTPEEMDEMYPSPSLKERLQDAFSRKQAMAGDVEQVGYIDKEILALEVINQLLDTPRMKMPTGQYYRYHELWAGGKRITFAASPTDWQPDADSLPTMREVLVHHGIEVGTRRDGDLSISQVKDIEGLLALVLPYIQEHGAPTVVPWVLTKNDNGECRISCTPNPITNPEYYEKDHIEPPVAEDPKCLGTYKNTDAPKVEEGETEGREVIPTLTNNTGGNAPTNVQEDNMTRTLTNRDDFRRAMKYEKLAKPEMGRSNLLIAREEILISLMEFNVDHTIPVVGVTNSSLARMIRAASRKLNKLFKNSKKEESMKRTKRMKIIEKPEAAGKVAFIKGEKYEEECPQDCRLCDESETCFGMFEKTHSLEEEEDTELWFDGKKVGEVADDFAQMLIRLSTKENSDLVRGRAKSLGWVGKYVMEVFSPEPPKGKDKKEGRKAWNKDVVNVYARKMVGPVGLMERIFQSSLPCPVIQLMNNQRLDDNGHLPPIPRSVLDAAWDNGYVLVKDKWLVRQELIVPKDSPVAKTLPTDKDVRGYFNGLAAPMEAVEKVLCHFSIKTTTILDVGKSIAKKLGYKKIPAGVDGAGAIHPYHWLWDVLGLDLDKRGWVQFRAWDPEKGVLVKGLLVADMRAVDADGNPAVVFDLEQVKGEFKDYAKDKLKLAKAALEAGEEPEVTSMELWFGVMASSHRIERQWASGQLLQFMEDSEENHQYLMKSVDRFFKDLSFEQILEGVKKKDEHIRCICEMLVACGEDPMSNVLVQQAVYDKLARQFYRVAQGGGIRGWRYRCVMDEKVKPGTCWIRPEKIDGKMRFKVDDTLAATRSPGVGNGAASTFVVAECPEEFLVPTGYGMDVPYATIYVNPKEADFLQLDDDGDALAIWYQTFMVDMMRSRIKFFGDVQDAYRIEPAKGGDDIIGGHEWGGDKWRDFIADSGKGPIGETTLVGMAWMALKHYDEFMPSALHLQAGVDEEKRASRYADPDIAKDQANWTVEEEYDRVIDADGNTVRVKAWKYTPVNPNDPEDEEYGWLSTRHWATDKHGLLIREKINWLFSKRTLALGYVGGFNKKGEPKGLLPGQVNTWRVPEKKKDPENWSAPEYTGDKQGLVHFCDWYACGVAQKWMAENCAPKPSKRLSLLLLEKLGVVVHPIPEEVYMAGLRVKAGIKAYREGVRDLARNVDENTDRSIEYAALQAALEGHLRQLSTRDLLEVWMSELMLANTYRDNPTRRDSHVKMAFKAVAWDGSPIMKKLGISNEEMECSYMDPEKLEKAEALVRWWATRKVDGKPVFQDYHEIINRMVFGPWGDIAPGLTMPRPAGHHAATGKHIDQCRVCREALTMLGVRMSRETPSEETSKQVLKLKGGMSRWLYKAR